MCSCNPVNSRVSIRSIIDLNLEWTAYAYSLLHTTNRINYSCTRIRFIATSQTLELEDLLLHDLQRKEAKQCLIRRQLGLC